MSTTVIFRFLFLSCLLAVTAGCAVNPVTGKKELSLVSPEQEVAIGAQNYEPSKQAQGGTYELDPELQTYVARVGHRLAGVSDRESLPYEFVVLNNPVPNAWALPGGKIAINTGLLVELEDEAQLAAVLGHEIVHAAARHSASQMSRGVLFNLGTQVAGVASQQAGYGSLGGLAAQLGSAAWMARYGRDDELEADTYGMEYMREAGYDPMAAVELQQTFVRLSEGNNPGFISGLFASHPPSQARVERNRAKAAQLPSGGVRNREEYQRRIAQLKEDWPAYEAQQEAMAALKAKEPDKALALLDKARAIQPNDGSTWELRGHAWQMKGNEDNAYDAFSTAIKKNPHFFSHYLARGVLLYDQGKRSQAKPDLEKSYNLLPTNTASYYLGEMAYSAGNTREAVDYYQQAASSESAMGQAAQRKLVHLQLSEAPHQYIPAQAYVGDDGYLRVVIENRSGIDVGDITLEVVQMRNAYVTAGSRRLRGPDRLAAGQRWGLNTGIGPFTDQAAARAFQVRVISASPQ